MSRLVYFDCANGASGDMLLGALVDGGVPFEELQSDLARLALEGVRLEMGRVHRAGLEATHVRVHAEGRQPHRHLRDIRELIAASGLERDVRERSTALFERLADAEAGVHGTTPDRIHFHEVGAADSIADIVLGVSGLARLGADRFAASPLNLGSGEVEMAHGRFPVPAPATARLVEGVPVYGAGEGELLTPTGALLVTAYATSWGPLPAMRVERIGYGAGTRDPKRRPNVLRLLIGEALAEKGDETVLVLECELDDMSPELLAPLLEQLLEAGALDAYLTPILMKKGRPGQLVSVLAPPSRREAVEELLFRETTTLGVRSREWERRTLERESVSVATPWGEVRVKLGRRGDRLYNASPEFEDCRRLARDSGTPLKEVWSAAIAAWRRTREND
jgi:hypothetical protein